MSSKFSFGRIFFGLTCGVTIPFVVHDNVYYCIATCFLTPHLKYHKEKAQRHHTLAIPVESLDNYFVDVGKSFLFFWLVIGPTLYKTYVLKENLFDPQDLEDSQNGRLQLETKELLAKRDTYSDIVKKIKQAEKTKEKAQLKKDADGKAEIENAEDA